MVELILRLNELLTPAGARDPDVVQAFIQFLPAAIAAGTAIHGALSGRSAGKKAERLQREQIEEARGFRDFARAEYDERAPLRELSSNRLMDFRGAPGNPFASQLFGPPPSQGGFFSSIIRALQAQGGGGGGLGGGMGPGMGVGTPPFNPAAGGGVGLRRIDPSDPLTMYSIGIDRSQRDPALEAIYRSLGLGG